MTKAFVDSLISNMKQAGVVTKATPWMVEGFGDKQLNTRYVGFAIKNDWLEIMSAQNNLLIKFIVGRNDAYMEFYLANKPPFLKITQTRFTTMDKWEILLGELKRRLKKDKTDALSHRETVGNLYKLIEPLLK
ncbi:MAG TPA: hypothetical protein VF820_03145 [Patescibacteria group bacterium]